MSVDDQLPVSKDKLLALESDHSDEFWPALLEKACAQYVFASFTVVECIFFTALTLLVG